MIRKTLMPSVFFIVLFAVAALSQDEGVDVNVTLNPSRVTVGDPFEVVLRVKGRGLELKVPEKGPVFPENDTEKDVPLFRIISTDLKKTGEDNSGIKLLKIRLACYRPGSHELPVVEVKGEDGIPVGYRNEKVNVTAVNPEGKVQEPEGTMGTDSGGLYSRAIILLLFLAMLVLLFLYIRKRRHGRIEESWGEKIDPYEFFISELKRLRKYKISETENCRELASELSRAFRDFTGSVFFFDALESTTSEVLEKMRSGCSTEHLEGVRTLLELWDQARFSSEEPSSQMLKSSIDEAEKLAVCFREESSDNAA